MASFTLDDLLNLKPSVVSRDLSGYITYIYGEGGVGKTTLAKDMKAFIISCEAGTHAMSGAYSQIVQSWSDIKALTRFFKDPRMKEKYKAVAVDTVDIAAQLCEKYICSQNDVEKLGQIAYGGGWTAFKKEFEEVFRGITLQGYAVLFISHSKEKEFNKPDGTSYTQIVPTVSDSINNIVRNMSDIQGYGYQEPGTENRFMILRSNGSVQAKSRFPYMESKIPFGYDHLTEALNRAIDEEERHNGSQAVTNEKINYSAVKELNFDDLMNEFNSLINGLIAKTDENEFITKYQPRIIEITDKYLGVGKKVSQCSRAQTEQLELIIDELKEIL